jgi:hypothetical protein
MSMGVASDRDRVPTVDHDLSLRVADQKERHRHVETADPECAALEQIQLKATRHEPMLSVPRTGSMSW